LFHIKASKLTGNQLKKNILGKRCNLTVLKKANIETLPFFEFDLVQTDATADEKANPRTSATTT